MPFITRAFGALFAVLLVAGLVSGSVAQAQTVETEADAYSEEPSISGDGRYVAFTSAATNLVANDADAFIDVIVRDRTNGVNILASVSRTGGPADGYSEEAAVSANGRYVVFASDAENLATGDSNNINDIFVRDLQSGTTSIASLSWDEAQSNAGSHDAGISPDGRYVVFSSDATNLTTEKDTNSTDDIFLRDRTLGTTERISVSSSEGLANGASFHPTVSADGRYVAFRSWATNLAGTDSNGADADIFVRDRTTTNTYLVSTGASGQGNNPSESNTWISDTGRYIAFKSTATNLVSGDNNGKADVFRRDTTASSTQRSSLTWDNREANDHAGDWLSISGDGNKVAFFSRATNMVAQSDTNAVNDVFVRNHSAATTTRVSVSTGNPGTQGNGVSDRAQISSGGGFVAFQSDATNLVSNDTNGVQDIFVRDLTANTTERVSVLTRENNAPVAQLSVDPEQGDTNTTFNASMAGSYDPDGDPITYSIDWGDGTVTAGPTGSHRYARSGDYAVTGTVTDSYGVSSSSSRDIRVCDRIAQGNCIQTETIADRAEGDIDGHLEPLTHQEEGTEGEALHWTKPQDAQRIVVLINSAAGDWRNRIGGRAQAWNPPDKTEFEVRNGSTDSSLREKCPIPTKYRRVRVCSFRYDNPKWGGLASVSYVEGSGHIQGGKVRLDTADNLSPSGMRYVICQELGHILGLAHKNDSGYQSCMNQASGYENPAPHDFTQIDTQTHQHGGRGGNDDVGDPTNGDVAVCTNTLCANRSFHAAATHLLHVRVRVLPLSNSTLLPPTEPLWLLLRSFDGWA